MKTRSFRYSRLFLIAALMIATAGVLPSSASAAPIVVLSNLGGATQGMGTGGFEAIGFTTPASPVYALTSATLEIIYSCPVDAWLYTNNGGVPGTSLAAFTQISSGQVITLPQPYVLAASTSYWIVVGQSCGGSPGWNQKAIAPTGIFTYLGSAHSNTQVSPSWTVFFNYIFSLSAELVLPDVDLLPTSLNFGNQIVGTTSVSQIAYITNNGFADLHIGSLSISGDFGFAYDNCSNLTLAPGYNCAVQVVFSPLTAGPLNGSVSIPSDAPTTPDTLPLSGTGILTPIVDLSAANLNFGYQPIGVASAPQTVTVTNTGSADLHIGALGINSDFGLSNDTCSNATVTPANSCTFDVIFQPLSVGPKAGSVSIPSDAGTSPDSVSLSGNGVALITGNFISVGSYDGTFIETNENSGIGTAPNIPGGFLDAGDTVLFNRQTLNVLHFNTSTLPDNAVVVSVSIQVKQYQIVGTNPMTTHGALNVDIVSPFFGTGMSLVASDFQAAASAANVGFFNTIPLPGNWFQATLDSGAFPFLNLSGSTQFRVHFTLDDDNDGRADLFRVYSGNSPLTANRPVLIVEYYVP